MASVRWARRRPGMWLSSAIQETLQPPCAWELLEAELLEHICAEVKRAHPSCDVPVEGEESLAEALEQTKGAARALLAEHAERVEEQHITVATAAAAAIKVRRAARRFKEGGKRYLKERQRQAAEAAAREAVVTAEATAEAMEVVGKEAAKGAARAAVAREAEVRVAAREAARAAVARAEEATEAARAAVAR